MSKIDTTKNLSIGKRIRTYEIPHLEALTDPGEPISGANYNNHFGAHVISLSALGSTSGSEWKSCLGDVEGYSNLTGYSPVMYFPSIWRSGLDVEKWCDFLNDVLNFKCRYLGEGFVGKVKFAPDSNQSKDKIRCHIVALDYQEDLYRTCNRAILSKVTLIRYIYRTDHYEKIILPLYEMVAAGLNPWDALFLSHYHGFGAKVEAYNAGRALMYAPITGVYIMYPRSYKEVIKLFDAYGYINHVWSSVYLTNDLFTYHHSVEKTFLTSDTYSLNRYFHTKGQTFYSNPHEDKISHFIRDPHGTIIKATLEQKLLDKDWLGAFNYYKEVVLSHKKAFEGIGVNHDLHVALVGRKFIPQYIGSGHTQPPYDKHLRNVLDFINSFEKES